MIEDDFYSELSNYAGITAIVSDRVYDGVLPQGISYPAIRFFGVSFPPIDDSDGVDTQINRRYQVDMWGPSKATLNSLREEIFNALDNSTKLTYAAISLFDLPYDSKDELFGVSLTVSIWGS